MKHIILSIATTCLLAGAAFAAKPAGISTVPASDSRITWVGRTAIDGDNVSFDWTGVYARIKFSGNSLSMKVSDTKKNYYNVWFDNASDRPADKVITTFGTDSLIVLVSEAELKARYGKKLPKTPHEVVIQKRTEGEQGKTSVHAFITDGEILQAEPLKPRMLEFIGDSYTCGYGTEGLNAKERFRPDTENCNYAYEFIVGRYFDADIVVVAHSGMGIARNYNDKFKDWYMPERYTQLYDEERESKWDAASSPFKPAATIILLGANDFSVSRQPHLTVWKRQYTKLLKQIKENYGADHPIICCSSKSSAEVFAYIKATVEDCGLKNVSYMGHFTSVFSADELGSDFHPNYAAHKKIAFSILPHISTVTNWPLGEEVR